MKLSKSFLLVIITTMLVCTLTGQSVNGTLIDINAQMHGFEEQRSSDPVIAEMFKDTERYRTFDFNRDLLNLSSRNIGDLIGLTFFDDAKYTAEILEASVNEDGRTMITARVTESLFAYAFITVDENAITISVDIPENDEYFFASVKYGQTYLGQAKLSEMAKDELPCSVVDMPQCGWLCDGHHNITTAHASRNNVTIDLLFVYSLLAEGWAELNWSTTDISHLIDIALMRSNLVMHNSETGVIFNIVHRHLTNYIETDTSEDFYSITLPNDGYMDEVHVLRNTYGADLIVFLAFIDYTGGTAWLLPDFEGFSEDYFAVSINRVQQAASSYTVVHEIGHNMGAHHHRDQSVQPGPNYNLGDYTSGWRGNIQNTMSVTVMSYDSGTFYSDGINGVRIPYFSSPLITVDGTIIGNATLADNARIIRETKELTSNYRPNARLNDLSAYQLTGDLNIHIDTPTTYTIRIANTGLNAANSYIVRLRQEGNNTPLATTDGLTILPNNYLDFDLIWTPLSAEITKIYAEVVWAMDMYLDNNKTNTLKIHVLEQGTLIVEIGGDINTTRNYGSPINFNERNSISQTIYLQSEIDTIGIITSLFYNFSGEGNVSPNSLYRVYLAETQQTEFTSVQSVIPYYLFTMVYEGTLPFSFTGMYDVMIPLDNKFHYTGGNLAIMIHRLYENQSYGRNNAWQNTPLPEQNRTIAFSGSNPIDMNNLSTSSMELYSRIANIKIIMEDTAPNIFFPPQNIMTTAGNQLVNISWDEPVDGSSGTLSGYKLYRGSSAININLKISGEMPIPQRTYEDTGLTNGNTYFYQIVAVYTDAEGESPRSPTSPIQAIPHSFNPPRQLSLTVDNGSVTLSWRLPNHGGATLSGYKVYRGTDQTELSEIAHITSSLNPSMTWVNNTDLTHGSSYYYAVKASYSSPETGDSEYSNIENSGPVSESEDNILPITTELEANYPNPFNPETTIRFSLKETGSVKLDIFNIKGSLVKTLIHDHKDRGHHSVIWNGIDENGSQVSSGIYFYRLMTNEYSSIKKMLLLK